MLDLAVGRATIEKLAARTFKVLTHHYPYDRWDAASKETACFRMRTIISAYLVGQTLDECARRLACWARVEKAKLPLAQRLRPWEFMDEKDRRQFLRLAAVGYNVLKHEEDGAVDGSESKLQRDGDRGAHAPDHQGRTEDGA